jgi:hypothetical protein
MSESLTGFFESTSQTKENEMRSSPQLYEIVFGDRGMAKGIKACLDEQCLVSAVALIYSCVDSVSALTRDDPAQDTSINEFTTWVERYLLPNSSLRCNAIDIYAARCGVLHNYGHDSRKRREGKALPLVYEWRDGPKADADVPLPKKAEVIVVEELELALTKALNAFLEDVDECADLAKRVNTNLQELLCYIPYSNAR